MRNEEKQPIGDEINSTSKVVDERLFKRRHVLITGEINDRVARSTTERLLALASENDDPINVFISSPGGHVESGDMIHDIIKFIKPTVRTIGSGWVASAGATIFVGADIKNRFCLPNTRFLLHQPSGGTFGKVSDISIQAEQLAVTKDRYIKLFASATGQPPSRIAKDTERDFWLDTDAAIKYGLLGKVLKSYDELG